MKQLLTKIKQSLSADKCSLAAEAHAQLDQALENLQPLVDSTPAKDLNLEVFDKAIDEFEEVLEALECLLVGLTAPEGKKIKQTLEKDYADSIQLLKFYELLNPDEKTYTADYAEFTGHRFQLPTKPEILSRLTPQTLKLYQKMEQDGLQPKLQITPIAFQIHTLVKKFDAKAIMNSIGTTYVIGEIKDGDLQYAPTSITASPDGTEIQISGGLTKSQWIRAHGGFLIDIVPTKPELDADLEIEVSEGSNSANSHAIQAGKHAAKLKANGLTPMSYESYLLAQMQAIKAGHPLEVKNWSLLFDSNLKDRRWLAAGYWNVAFVGLDRLPGDQHHCVLRSRASIRLS